MKAILLGAVLALTLLVSASREANACQFCKLESDGWHCVPCLPLIAHGASLAVLGLNARRNWTRARLTLDAMVPAGTPSTPAASS